MDQQPNVSLENPTKKPSKLMALIALVIAFALPFILVKSFPHKQKANDDNRQPSAPKLQDRPSTTQAPVPETPHPAEASINHQPLAHSKASSPIAATPKAKASSTANPSNSRTKTASTQTKIPAISTQSLPRKQKNENKSILTRRRDSLAAVFGRIGLSRQLLQSITRENPRIKFLARLRPNEQLQYQIKNHTLERMAIPFSSTQFLVLYHEGRHYKTKLNFYKITSKNHYVTASVRHSLYATAKRHNIPYQLIQQMTEIFAWDINFARDVRVNDRFTIIYKTTYANERIIKTGEIVAVSYKNRGRTFQAVLHTNRRGRSDYYSPQGKSLKNAFNRYPLRFSHISSTFNLARLHPILRYKRSHKGIDLAAPIGTPILATGDGRIEIIGRQSGYGNMIKIRHNKTYSTIYGHMLKFQKGLSRRTFVKRGQVIGYVGQSGLATGPHCHYEFHINQQPKNPTTIHLPRGDPLSSTEIASFRTNANNLLNLVKLYESDHFAKAKGKNKKQG